MRQALGVMELAFFQGRSRSVRAVPAGLFLYFVWPWIWIFLCSLFLQSMCFLLYCKSLCAPTLFCGKNDQMLVNPYCLRSVHILSQIARRYKLTLRINLTVRRAKWAFYYCRSAGRLRLRGAERRKICVFEVSCVISEGVRIFQNADLEIQGKELQSYPHIAIKEVAFIWHTALHVSLFPVLCLWVSLSHWHTASGPVIDWVSPDLNVMWGDTPQSFSLEGRLETSREHPEASLGHYIITHSLVPCSTNP